MSGKPDVWEPAEGGDHALDAVKTLASRIISLRHTYVLMCAEIDPQRCHRRFVAESIILHVPGLQVVHL